MSTLNFNGLSLSRGHELSDSGLLAYAKDLSTKRDSVVVEEKILHWDFGPIMNMRFDPEAPNYLFSAEEVPLHWDGAFYREPAKLLFYCTETAGTGGETLFLNTELLWDSFTDEEKARCERITMKYKTEKKAHYGGEILVPLVQKHPMTGKTILRMAEKVETQLNPVELEIFGADNPDEFYQWMKEKISNPDFLYAHRWEKGDLVVCDNFTYLHGRRALKNNLVRSFKRIQIL